MTVGLCAAAPANTGFPNIHTPRLYGDGYPFGGAVDIYIGNSSESTQVRTCISGRCIRMFASEGSNYLRYSGSAFRLTLARGQRRTVSVVAINGRYRSQWGPARVAVR
jgi:hypothetical protein